MGEVNGEILINNSSIGIYPFLVLERERRRRRKRLSKWTAILLALPRAIRHLPVSLQLVSGRLDMQSRGVGSSETAEQLALASSRVATIAQVHRHIYQSDGVDKVGCRGYLERLCAELSRTLRSAESDAIAVVGDEVELPTAPIVPLGLIVNEH